MIYKILITDEKAGGFDNNLEYFHERASWAQEHCPSYVGMDICDVSDVSGSWDEITEYMFNDEQDYLLFLLRWA